MYLNTDGSYCENVNDYVFLLADSNINIIGWGTDITHTYILMKYSYDDEVYTVILVLQGIVCLQDCTNWCYYKVKIIIDNQ